MADRSIRRSVDAHPVLSIRVGASIQEQPNHLQMTLLGGVKEGGWSTLRETGTYSATEHEILPDTTSTHSDSHTIRYPYSAYKSFASIQVTASGRIHRGLSSSTETEQTHFAEQYIVQLEHVILHGR